MKHIFVFCLMISLWITAMAGDEFPEKSDDVLLNRQQLMTELQSNLDEEIQQENSPKHPSKSVAKAAIFSALVPGSGQLYAGSYWKAAAFFAVEVAAWTLYFTNTQKGDDKDAEFKGYADENWSEYRYWSYVNYLATNDEFLSSQYDLYPYQEMILNDEHGQRTWYLIDEGEYDQATIDYLRQIENQFPTGSGFTHHLPETKTQQYYEMIGKYPKQFGNAWYDGDFLAIYQDFGQGNITSMNQLYATMRDDANQFYKTAGYGTMIVLINHLVSAIDAGFTARSFNNRQMELSYQNRRFMDQRVDMFGLTVAF